MPELPLISGKAAAKAFEKDGWYFDRQAGSHLIYKKADIRLSLSIPEHNILDRGLLRRLIRDSGLTVAEFISLLKG